MKKMLLTLMILASAANAQIGWTLDQCRKHWGRESISTHHLESLNDTTYGFGSEDAGIYKEVTLDPQGKVNDLMYTSNGGGRYDNKPSLLDIPGLLATQTGIIWGKDPGSRILLGKKDGVVVFQARYFSGKHGESLHVVPIETPF
jgi:hypothetical protein